MSNIPAKITPIVKAAYEGNLPEGEILTFDRILTVAEEAKRSKGYVQYSDYEADLLTEALNGFWSPSALGFRLQTIRYVLMQRGWKPEGRPVKFYPPK